MSTFISRRIFLCVAGGTLAAPTLSGAANDVPAFLDHILLGCSDLDRGVAFVEERTGVRAAFGGIHPGRGTQNALLSLGTRRYLEIIAPDPKQSGPQQYPVITKLTEPSLIGWAAHPGDLRSFAAKLANSGIAAGGPAPGSRRRPDGRVLQWQTLTLKANASDLLPFFIEWSADSIHPSVDSPKVARFCVSKLHLPIQRHSQSKSLSLALTSPSSKVTTRNSAPLSLVRKPNSL